MKVAKACQQCRSTKRKCQRAGLDRACLPCSQRQQQCSLTLRRTYQHQQLAPLGHNVSDQLHLLEALLSQELALRLVEHYIHFIHDKPHSLFHQPTLRRIVQDQSISKHLLFSICSLGSRFSEDAQTRLLAPQLAIAAKRLLLPDIENICIENIQVCILVANICAAEMESNSEALYFGEILILSSFARLQGSLKLTLRRNCDPHGARLAPE
jgi:hypothetical protein